MRCSNDIPEDKAANHDGTTTLCEACYQMTAEDVGDEFEPFGLDIFWARTDGNGESCDG